MTPHFCLISVVGALSLLSSLWPNYWPGHETLIDDALKSLEEEFKDRFLRVHRNALVALAHIDSLQKDNQGKVCIRLKDVDELIEVSRRHLHEVKQSIKNINLNN